MERFDVFSKASDTELRVETKVGGLLSLIMGFFLSVLLIYEIRNFSENSNKRSYRISKVDLPEYINFSFNIDVKNTCKNLHFDITNSLLMPNHSNQHKISYTQMDGYCNIQAKGMIPSIPGSFHIGLGENYLSAKQGTRHSTLSVDNFDLSHHINSFIIGDRRINSTLDGRETTTHRDRKSQVTYILLLLPSIKDNLLEFYTLADASQSDCSKVSEHDCIPGIVFVWSFSPLEAVLNEKKEPLVSLLSRVLGIFGGFSAMVRLADSLLFRNR